MTPELREGEYRREGTPAAPGAASTLLVVRHSRGNIAHPHAEEAANVDSHLHGGGHRENIDAVVIGMLVVMEKVLKPAFLVSGFHARDLGRVFHRSQWIGIIEERPRERMQSRAPIEAADRGGRERAGWLATPETNVERCLAHNIRAGITALDSRTDKMEVENVDADAMRDLFAKFFPSRCQNLEANERVPQWPSQVPDPLVRRSFVGKALHGNKRPGNGDDVTPQLARGIEIVGNSVPPLVGIPFISPNEYIALIFVHHFIWPLPRSQWLRGEENILGGEDASHSLKKQARLRFAQTGECAERFRESDTPVSEPQGFQCKFSFLREFAAQTHMKGSLRPLEASRISLLHFPEVFTYEPICRIDPSLNLELDHARTHLFERERPGVGMPSRSQARVARR